MGGPGTSGRSGGPNLRTAVKQWPTPAGRDWRSGGASEKTMQKNARPLSETVTGGKPGQLNPDWVEWMMGWPIGWTRTDGGPLMIHYGWEEDPAEWSEYPIPRLATKVPNRVARLKAIGNGQVPHQARAAFLELWERMEAATCQR